MTLTKMTLFYSIAIIAVLACSAFAQEEVFTDPNVDYTFILPEPEWIKTVKPSATSPNVEYVHNDRNDAHLEVRKLTVTKSFVLTEVIADESEKLQFKPGYVAGKEENFTGHLRGSAFNFEFVSAGRNMVGRFYFLKANDTTVYVLRFTGRKEKLTLLRNQTDSIARTFDIKH